MIDTFRKLLDLLTPSERRKYYVLLAMIFVMAVLDMIGVASIMPFMSVLSDPEVIKRNEYLAFIYHKFAFNSAGEFVFFLGSLVLFSLILAIAFKAFTTYMLWRFTHMRNFSLSKRLVAGYLSQPFDWFLNRHSADLGKTVLSETTQVISGVLVPMMQFIANGAVVLSLVSLLVFVNPAITLTAIVVLGGAYGVIYFGLRRYLGNIGASRLQANHERFLVVQEAFGGIKEVKVGALEQILLRRFEKPAKQFAHWQAVSAAIKHLPRYVLEALVFGGLLFVVLYLIGPEGQLENLLPILPILAVYAVAGYRLMPAIQQVYAHLSSMRFSAPALEALHQDLMGLNEKYLGEVGDSHIDPSGLNNSLVLENIYYSYPSSSRRALVDVNLVIPANTTIGLVGKTGSGKTTLVDLILTLLKPESGKISVDEKEIGITNRRAWQRTIGYVPQSIYLADDTIASNIAFGIEHDCIDYRQVERVAQIANLHDFVTTQLPSRYDTVVGERGVRLSGGQRQRIGIARALYHEPDLLILDEATSALDNLTEQVVMEAVHNLGHSKTIIIIAHRLSTVRECDKIFIMEDGRIVDRGTYDELISRNKDFRAMVGE